MLENGPLPEQSIRPELRAQFDLADQILTPGFQDRVFAADAEGHALDPEGIDPLDPTQMFSGNLVDFNDPELTPSERTLATDWIEGRLGTALKDAPIKTRYVSLGGETTVAIYAPALGHEDDPFYLSSWQNEGEKDVAIILMREEMYQGILEDVFEEAEES